MNDEKFNDLDIAIKAVRAYAEMHPRPTQVNQTQAAQMLGLSHPVVRKLVRNGVLPLNDCGQIPIEAVDLARAARKAS
jgi:hypothetical protein